MGANGELNKGGHTVHPIFREIRAKQKELNLNTRWARLGVHPADAPRRKLPPGVYKGDHALISFLNENGG